MKKTLLSFKKLHYYFKFQILIIVLNIIVGSNSFAQCVTAISNNTIDQPVSGVCLNVTPATITGSAPLGGNGNYTFTWQRSTTSATTGFVNMVGPNNQSLSFSTGLTATTWYRRVVTSGACTSTSTAYPIVVYNTIGGNTITPTTSAVCNPSTPGAISGSVPTGGDGNYKYEWLSSTTSNVAGFSSAAGINNSASYTFPGNISQTMWFRRVVSTIGGCSSTSPTVHITVFPPITNNIISQSQSICTGQTPVTLTGATLGGGSGTYTYQWESSTTSASSGFTTAVGTSNTSSYTPTALSQTTWFRRTVTSGGCTSVSTPVQIIVNSTAQGDPAVFGLSQWNAYAYQDQNFSSYAGFYTDASLSFNSTNKWTQGVSPSLAPDYSGCQVPNDYHSVAYKRQGFPSGTYQIDVPSHDDDAFLYINGSQVWLHNGCCDAHTAVWTGYLDASSTVEFRWRDGSGSSYGSLTFNSIATPALTAGSIGYNQQICPGDDPFVFNNLVAASGICYNINYQWQYQVNCTGAWIDITGATASTYDVPAGLSSTNCYRRIAKDACLNSVASNTVQVNVSTVPPGDPSQYGNNIWNAYVFSNNNFTSYTGYYTENNLSFASTSRWASVQSPVFASIQDGTGYWGCQTVPTDGFSIAYKRRGFPAATYQIDIPNHDDDVYLLINGTMVFTHSGYGDSHTNSWTGPLDANSTVELRWFDSSGPCLASLDFTQVLTPTSINPGLIGYDQEICINDDPIPFDNAASASGGCYAIYQWQYQTNCTGPWTNITGATTATYDVSAGLAQTTCYRRVASDVCGNTAISTIVTITVSTPIGNPSSFGNGVWNVYSYNGNFGTYAGYYVDPSLNFNTTTRWGQGLNPSAASGYQGCQLPNDNFSFVHKRQNFPVGIYQIDVPDHDDNVSLYVNGTLVFSHNGCCDAHTAVWTGPLNSSSTVEMRVVEGAGSSNGAINFTIVTPTPLIAGTIGSDQIICPGDDPAIFTNITSSSGGCYPTYQWQYQVNCTGAWIDISGATSLTYDAPAGLIQNRCYRRVVNDLCGNSEVSNTAAVTMGTSLGNPSVFGNNTWNVYTYSGNFGTYLGYYTEPSLTFSTPTQWTGTLSPSSAPGFQGCQVPVNSFSASFKRTNFTPGTYQIDVTFQDDAGSLFINGIQMYSAGCCNPVNNIWTGYLDASSTVEFRLVETTGTAGLGLSFTNVTPTTPLNPGAIGGTQTICYGGNPVIFTSTTLGTSGCSVNYQWQYQINCTGTWLDIPGATAATYDVPAGLSQTTCYRRFIRDACNNTDFTTTITVTVYNNMVAGVITGSGGNAATPSSPTICTGTSPGTLSSASLTTGGTGTYNYGWQQSTNGGTTWNTIGGATSSSYTPGNLTITTQYRRVETSSGGCGTVYSNIITVTVNPTLTAGVTISASPSNIICTGTSVTFTATPTNGGLAPTYQWTLNGVDVVGQTGATFTKSNYNNGEQVRVRMTSNASPCLVGSPVTSASTTMIVHSAAPGPAGLITPPASAIVCQGQNNVGYTVPAIANAATYIWSLPSGAAIASGANTRSITVNYASSASSGLITVRGSNGCGLGAISANYSVTVNNLPSAAGAISGLADICKPLSGASYSISPVTGATSYIWTVPTGATIVSGGTSNSITLDFTSSAASGNITVTPRNSCGNGIAATLSVTVNNGAPTFSGTITGTSLVCSGATGIAYSIPSIINATSYVWTLPSGASISSGSNTNSITVDFSGVALSGNITVSGINNCGSGPASAPYPVTVSPSAPDPAGAITGTSSVCQVQNSVNYSVPVITNAENYHWTIPAGATIVGGSNTNSITVNFGSSAVSGDVNVYASNGCGTGTISSNFGVMVNPLPEPAGAVNGTSIVCQGQSGVVYSVPSINNATSYTWTLPAGVLLTSGSGTNVITVDFTTSSISGNIIVTGNNACGNGVSSQMAVTVNPLPVPAGTITGSATVCQGVTGSVYTVPAIAYATSYSWTVPSGVTIVSGSATNTITVNYSVSASSGGITVRGINSCGNGVSSSLSITVNPLPDAAGLITGTTEICRPRNLVSYSVMPIHGATSYSWVLPSGANISSGANTNSIQVNFSSSAVSGSIFVFGKNSCGNGQISAAFPVTVSPGVPGSGTTITGNRSICIGMQGVPYSVPAIANATNYIWNLPSGATIATGANSNSITVNYSLTAVSGNISVRGTNSCGTSATLAAVSIAVFTTTPDAPGTISGSNSICPGQSGVVYSIPAITNANGYSWTLPAGATITAGMNTNSIIVSFSTIAISGDVSVNGTNGCGSGPIASYPVIVNPPLTDNTISGDQTTCTNMLPNALNGSQPTGGTGTYTYMWQRSTAAATVGFANAPGTNNGQSYSPAAQSVTSWYRRIVNSGSCTSISPTIQITILPAITNNISASQSICINQTPAQLTALPIAGGYGTYTYLWESSVTSGAAGFAAASGINDQEFYSPGSLAESTWYRRTVYSNNCATTSSVIKITVNNIITNNSIQSNQVICYNSVPSTLVPAATLSGGSGTYTYLWESSTTSSSSGFTAAPGINTSANYAPGALTSTTWFRRTVYSGGCTDTSLPITISVTAINNNSVTANQTICNGGTPLQLEGGTPTGGNDTFTYQWESSTSSATTGFAVAPGSSNNGSYNPPALLVNTWFRRTVFSAGCSNTSSAVMITVNPLVTNNTISSSPQIICYNQTPATISAITPSGGNNGYAYQWESSTTSSTTGFGSASGTITNASYSPGALTVTTWYRRIVTSGPCINTSTAIQITVNPLITNNTIANNQTICSGAAPSTLSGSTPTNGGGPGTYIYSWESSPLPASGFVTASGLTSEADYSPGTLSATTYFRRRVTSGNCTDYSNTITITVNPNLPLGVSISANPSNVVCSGTITTFTASLTNPGSTNNYQWRLNGANVGTNNASYSSSTLTNGDEISCVVTSSGGCISNSPATSTNIVMTVNHNWTGTVSPEWNNPSNWCGGVPIGINNAIIGSAPFMPQISTSGTCKNLLMASGTSLTIVGSGIIDIKGTWTNNGTFNPGTGKVIYSGNTSQNVLALNYYSLEFQGLSSRILPSSGQIGIGGSFIPGTNPCTYAGSHFNFNSASAQSVPAFTFSNVIISGGGAKTLAGNVIIEGTLDLVQGKVFTSSSSILSLNQTANITGGNTSSFVSGPMTKAFNSVTPFVFPVGKDSLFRRVELEMQNTNPATFSIEYFNANPQGSFGSSKELTIDHISALEYWQINRLSGTTNSKVGLYWGTSSKVSSDPADLSELVVGHYNSTLNLWEDMGMITVSSGANVDAGKVKTAGYVSSFSPFTLCSGTQRNLLPVRFITFAATRKNEDVLLNWQTTEEINNLGFVIERSYVNSTSFDSIGFTGAPEYSGVSLNYLFTDTKNSGLNAYYRLKQVDFNGDHKYSSLVFVNGDKEKKILDLYPNPTNGNVKIITNLDLKSEKITYNLHSVSGVKLSTGKTNSLEDLEKALSLVLTHQNAGLYILTLLGDEYSQTVKVEVFK